MTFAPGYGTAIRDVETAIAERPKGIELIFAGDLNVDLGKEGEWGRDGGIVAALATEGLENLVVHFFPIRRAWCRDRRTWGAVSQGRVVRYRAEYILGTDRRILHSMAVWDPRHNSDHFMVVGCLHGASLR